MCPFAGGEFGLMAVLIRSCALMRKAMRSSKSLKFSTAIWSCCASW